MLCLVFFNISFLLLSLALSALFFPTSLLHHTFYGAKTNLLELVLVFCLVFQESLFSDGLNSLNVITLFSKPDIFIDIYNLCNLLPLTFKYLVRMSVRVDVGEYR